MSDCFCNQAHDSPHKVISFTDLLMYELDLIDKMEAKIMPSKKPSGKKKKKQQPAANETSQPAKKQTKKKKK